MAFSSPSLSGPGTLKQENRLRTEIFGTTFSHPHHFPLDFYFFTLYDIFIVFVCFLPLKRSILNCKRNIYGTLNNHR